MWRLAGLACLGLILATGCSKCHDCARDTQAFGPAPAPMRLASSLLFDPIPSRYNATDFAARSDWPSTQSYYQGGQMVFFSERFYDVQGRNQSNATFRRFDTFRSGFGYR